jgi:predicted RNase H-like nuclease (RuvC/YqgF family)
MGSGTPRIFSLRPVESPPVREIPHREVISTPEREGFIAEAAVKLEQLQAANRLLSREVADLTAKVSQMQEIAGQDHRLHAFDQQERRGRDGKLEELARGFRDLKARIDRMEARSTGDYHAYTSFEAVSRKFAELESRKRHPKLRIWLFGGALVVVAVVGLGLQYAGGQV